MRFLTLPSFNVYLEPDGRRSVSVASRALPRSETRFAPLNTFVQILASGFWRAPSVDPGALDADSHQVSLVRVDHTYMS